MSEQMPQKPVIKGNGHAACDWDIRSEEFVAELTRAAYAVALRHGTGHPWLDLELDLWQVLTNTVEEWGWQRTAST